LFYPYKNYYLVGTDKGLCRYDKSTDRFVPDSTFGKQFCNGSRDVFSFISDKQRKVWISGLNNRLGPIGISTPLKDGTYEWNSAPFRTIPEMMVLAFYVDDDGIGWVGGSEGLYRYDPAIPEKKLTDFRALVRKVTLNQDSVIFYGNYFENQNNQKVFTFEQPKRFKPVIAYRYNSITFQFAATSYLDEKSNQYQHYLEGFDKEWSNWSKNTQKEYTNLPKGKYIFHVKAKNSYDQYSKEAIYEFQILPPWYRTHAAYLSYVIFLGLLIWLIVKIYTRRLLAQNIYLEKVVKERTSEILQQKEEIEAQRDELEKKNGRIERQNDLIKGSIRYAKTIQHAILPAKEELDKHYENFIIYRPKDIVSGDFYWFSEIKSNYQILNFIAVCDCTGHGVPGAFMSMIGNRLLNEIVNERQIFDPKTVLEMLNLGIRKALRQDVSDNTDGMDICFCRVERSEKDTVGIIFSGANRPLIYYSKTTGQVETIRNESRTIGGERKLKVMIEFENHALELDKGDCIYLSTDGFIDQNNFERKRLGSPNLYKIIQDNIQKSMTDQKTALDTFLDFWMKSTEQRDDITIVGLKM
jgi:serine phosphatase RsbU (regulator of sigma subunit)